MIDNRLLIRPKKGLKIINPVTGRPLAADSTTAVDANQFWFRRVRDGDVMEEKPGKTKPVLRNKKSDDQPSAKPADEKLGG